MQNLRLLNSTFNICHVHTITSFSLDFLQNNFLRDLIRYTKGYHGILLPKIAEDIFDLSFHCHPAI